MALAVVIALAEDVGNLVRTGGEGDCGRLARIHRDCCQLCARPIDLFAADLVEAAVDGGHQDGARRQVAADEADFFHSVVHEPCQFLGQRLHVLPVAERDEEATRLHFQAALAAEANEVLSFLVRADHEACGVVAETLVAGLAIFENAHRLEDPHLLVAAFGLLAQLREPAGGSHAKRDRSVVDAGLDVPIERFHFRTPCLWVNSAF